MYFVQDCLRISMQNTVCKDFYFEAKMAIY